MVPATTGAAKDNKVTFQGELQDNAKESEEPGTVRAAAGGRLVGQPIGQDTCPLSEGTILGFRSNSSNIESTMARAHQLEFDAPGHSPETHAIANVLRNCIVDAQSSWRVCGLLVALAKRQTAVSEPVIDRATIGAPLKK